MARALNPTLVIVVRTDSRSAVAALLEAGADYVIAEELEGIVQLFAHVLADYQVSPDEVSRQVEAVRADGYAAVQPQATAVPELRRHGLEGACLDTRRVLVRAGTPAAGTALAAAGVSSKHGLEVLAVQRRAEVTLNPPGDWVLRAGDRLVLRGSVAQFTEVGELFRRPDAAGADAPVSPGEEGPGADPVAPPTTKCPHSDQARTVVPRTAGCEECLASGGRWVHLRVCMTCGRVGCCDDSPGRHANAHFKATGHPIIKSLEPGESWGWCYVDEITL